MATELADKLKEGFSWFFKGYRYKDIHLDGTFVIIQSDKGFITYPYRVVNDILVVGGLGLTGLGNEDEEAIRNTLRLSEAAARELGFSQINYDADFQEDKKIAQEEGYIFSDEKYLGVKQLKWQTLLQE